MNTIKTSKQNNNNQNKLHHTLRILIFISGIIIITAILCPLFSRKDGLYVYDELAVKVKCEDVKAEPDNSIQVIFLGDSECYSSFSPKHLYKNFGYTSFVCGTAAQKICDSYAILHENFKTQSPDIVILETNNLFRGLAPVGDHWDPVLNTLLKNVPLFSNHSRWKPMVRTLLPKKREIKRRENKGFVRRVRKKAYTGGKYMKKTDKSKKINDDIKEYLVKINELCKENNATLILVSTPSATNWNYKKHNSVAKWADDNSVPYIDLNLEDEVNINWKKDTKDSGDHMNLRGAKKVTKFIGRYIKENYNLSDQR